VNCDSKVFSELPWSLSCVHTLYLSFFLSCFLGFFLSSFVDAFFLWSSASHLHSVKV